MSRLIKLIIALAWLWPGAVLGAQPTAGYLVRADCGTTTSPMESSVGCIQSTTVNGRTKGHFYIYTLGTWTDVTGTGTASAVAWSDVTTGSNTTALTMGTGGSLAPTGSGTITANRTGCTTGQYLAFDGSCPSVSATIDATANYAWTGTNSWKSGSWSLLDSSDATKILQWDISGFTTGTTRTFTLPNASTRLLGDSDFSAGTGYLARTGTNTYAERTLVGQTNKVLITNTTGAGNPTFTLGSLAVQADQSNTYSTGDQSFANAASLTFPIATGAAPTASGRCAYDSTANRLKCGFNGSTVTVAITTEIQPLNANLTALAALTGANARLPYFTGVGTMGTSQLAACGDTGGQHLNISSLSPLTFTCGTSSASGLSGLTSGKYLLATGATTADTSGSLSESGGVVNASGGFTVGSSPFLIFDTSAIASSDKTWTVLNFSGTIRPSTGALTAGNYVTTDANGLLIDGGTPGSGGTVTSIATTAPLGGGTITTTGTLTCATCVTSAASLTSNQLVLGAGSQASATLGSLGTTTTVLHGNAGGAPSFAAVSLPNDTTGTLTVAKGGTGTGSTLTGLVRGSASAMTAAELSGDVTTSGSNATTIAANAVTSAKMAVVNTRRTCSIIIPGTGSGGLLQDSDMGTTIDNNDCFINAASTLVEITVRADAGTPNIIVRRDRLGTAVNLVSSALATASSGAQACSNAGGTTGLDATTTCSATLQNTSLSAGDWLGVTSGTAGGTAHRISVALTYTIN